MGKSGISKLFGQQQQAPAAPTVQQSGYVKQRVAPAANPTPSQAPHLFPANQTPPPAAPPAGSPMDVGARAAGRRPSFQPSQGGMPYRGPALVEPGQGGGQRGGGFDPRMLGAIMRMMFR